MDIITSPAHFRQRVVKKLENRRNKRSKLLSFESAGDIRMA